MADEGHGNRPPATGWFKVPNVVAEKITEIGHAAILVYLVLARHADPDRTCWPSVSRIAKMVGISERSVRRSLVSLAAIGLVRRQAQLTPRGSAPNVYILSPQQPADTTDTGYLPCHPGGVPGVRPPLTPQIPEQDLIEQDPKNKTGPAPAGDFPPGLLDLIDGWNNLPPGTVKPGNGARRDPPSQAALHGWNRAQRNGEQREALQDIPRVLQAIRGATFCHGAGWFTIPWLFGKNKNGEFNIVKLLAGAHDGDPSDGRSSRTSQAGPGGRLRGGVGTGGSARPHERYGSGA